VPRTETAAYFISFDVRRLESDARDIGFKSPDWKALVLADLVDDESIRGVRVPNINADSVLFDFFGQRTAIRARVDNYRDDVLFAVGIYRGPAAGGRPVPKNVKTAKGPWRLLTLATPRRHVAEPLGNYLHSTLPLAQRSGVSHSHQEAPPRDPPRVTPLRWNPFQELRPSNAPRVPSPPSTANSQKVERDLDPASRGGEVPSEPSVEAPVLSVVAAPIAHANTSGAGDTVIRELENEAPGPSADADALVQSSRPPTIPPAAGTSLRLVHHEVPSSIPGTDGSTSVAQTWSAFVFQAATTENAEFEWLLNSSSPVAARQARIAALEAEIEEARTLLKTTLGRLDAVPDIVVVEELQQLAADVEGIAAAAPPPPGLTAPSTSSLREAIDLAKSPIVPRLPPWIVGESGEPHDFFITLLRSPSHVESLREVIAWTTEMFAGAAPAALHDLSSASGDGTLRERLAVAWSQHAARRSAMDTLPEVLRNSAHALSDEELQRLSVQLRQWRELLQESAYTDLIDHLATQAAQRWTEVAMCDTPLSNLAPSEIEDLRGVSKFKVVRRLLPTLLAAEQRPRQRVSDQPSANAGEGVRVQHVVTNEQGHIVSADIVIPHATHGDSPFRIAVPCRLRSLKGPLRMLELRIRAAHLHAFPTREFWPDVKVVDIGGERMVECVHRFATADWYESDGVQCAEVALSIPAFAHHVSEWQRRSELAIRVSCGDSEAYPLTFTAFRAEEGAIARAPTGTASPGELVTKRPMGVQVRHSSLERNVRDGGGSFMVIAPRRSGKTTLLQYLEEIARHNSAQHVVVADLARHLRPIEAVTELLGAIHKSLSHSFGAAPPLPEAKGFLLEDGYRGLRSFLAKHGIRRLLVLVDEAQVLVPRHRGDQWGNVFKNLEEHHIGRDQDAMARVTFGFFGTVDFGVKIGRNCRDFLRQNGVEAYDFDETALAAYMRLGAAGDIPSSREARLALARCTNNLWTLGRVLEAAVEIVRRDGRHALLTVDVRSAVDELLSSDGHRRDLWSYESSDLSVSDAWDPIDAFPVAVALARDDIQAVGRAERGAKCLEWLRALLRREQHPGTIARERVHQCTTELGDRGILDEDGEFRRPMLRRLLARAPEERILGEVKNETALSRLAVDVVEWHEDLSRSTAELGDRRLEGGQARVAVLGGERPEAYWHLTLASPEHSRRFARSCAAVRLIRDPSTRRKGDEHLPRLRQAGFRADDPSVAVIVYDWVPGESLATRPALQAWARTHVSQQVALALSALHSRGVLHCDVRPANIVVDGALHATLIDFGLARPMEASGNTAFPSDEWAAPELLDATPRPSQKSDSYSLGVLLMGGCEGRDLPPAVKDLASRLVNKKAPEERPDASEAAAALGEVLSGVSYEPQRDEARLAFRDLLRTADLWLREVLQPLEDAFVFAKCNYCGWTEHRAMEVAFHVQGVFSRLLTSASSAEAVALGALRESDRDDLSLNAACGKVAESRAASRPAASQKELVGWDHSEVRAVGFLRHAWAHPSDRETRLNDAARVLRSGRPVPWPAVRPAFERVIALLDRAAGTGSLLRDFFEPFVAGPR